MSKQYLDRIRAVMLEIIEKKLKSSEVLSSTNYKYMDKSLEELELMLLEYATKGDYAACDELRNEIKRRISQ